jgi:NADPH:quinone reductase-like Zn-dependent oxidoreductase
MLVAGASGGVGSVVLQLVESLLPGVRTIATSSRPETDEWVRSLGADAVVDHRGDDLAGQVRAAAPDGVDWVFTSFIEAEGALELYTEVLVLGGEIVAIDDPETLDVVPLKSKSLTLHWEFMGARALAGGDAQTSQHRVLTEIAGLVDSGRLRTTATTVLSPIDAATLREAHRLVEEGRVVGKVVVER